MVTDSATAGGDPGAERFCRRHSKQRGAESLLEKPTAESTLCKRNTSIEVRRDPHLLPVGPQQDVEQRLHRSLKGGFKTSLFKSHTASKKATLRQITNKGQMATRKRC